MATMTVEQGKCEIYPDARDQLCVRLRVLVWPLIEGPEGIWIEDEKPLRALELNCSQRGLNRLLKKIDDGITPPKKREAASDA